MFLSRHHIKNYEKKTTYSSINNKKKALSSMKRVLLVLLLIQALTSLPFSPSIIHRGPVFLVAAWTSPGASSLVVLRPEVLYPGSPTWNVLYETPAGNAALNIHIEGYRILENEEQATSGYEATTLSEHASPTTSRPTPFPNAPHVFATHAFHLPHRLPIPSFLMQPFDLTTNLTDRWEVIAKPGSGKLLHCRLPFPLQAEAVREREEKVLWHSGAGEVMASSLAKWWAASIGPRGIYGEGERLITGVEEWYVICPSHAIFRVNQAWLREVARQQLRDERGAKLSSNHSAEARAPLDLPKDQEKKEEENVIEQLRKQYLRCSDTFFRLVEDDSLREEEKEASGEAQRASPPKLAHRVGGFDAQKSEPHWNAQFRAWEMIFPGNHLQTPCTEEGNTTAEKRFWGTRIFLKCSRNRGSAHQQTDGFTQPHSESPIGSEHSFWRVTPVRQQCLVELELTSELVCLWDDYVDQLAVNPVPCAEIS